MENETTEKINNLIEELKDNITTLNYWLSIGDYTEQEHEPMKNDIKRYQKLIKKLESLKEISKELEIAI